MKSVQRIDFVCGGALSNAFNRLMAQAIDVRVVSASPIIQALMQLTGAPAALFVKA
jgi:anti-anti-sigma regulatory factor